MRRSEDDEFGSRKGDISIIGRVVMIVSVVIIVEVPIRHGS